VPFTLKQQNIKSRHKESLAVFLTFLEREREDILAMRAQEERYKAEEAKIAETSIYTGVGRAVTSGLRQMRRFVY